MILIISFMVYRIFFYFFFLMIRRPPRSTLFPTRRSSDLRGGRVRSHRCERPRRRGQRRGRGRDRKSTRLNSSHVKSSYAVFCLKKKKSGSRKIAKPSEKARGEIFSVGPGLGARKRGCDSLASGNGGDDFGCFFFNDSATT